MFSLSLLSFYDKRKKLLTCYAHKMFASKTLCSVRIVSFVGGTSVHVIWLSLPFCHFIIKQYLGCYRIDGVLSDCHSPTLRIHCCLFAHFTPLRHLICIFFSYPQTGFLAIVLLWSVLSFWFCLEIIWFILFLCRKANDRPLLHHFAIWRANFLDFLVCKARSNFPHKIQSISTAIFMRFSAVSNNSHFFFAGEENGKLTKCTWNPFRFHSTNSIRFLWPYL